MMVGIGFCGECLARIFRDEKYYKRDDKLICEDCFNLEQIEITK